MMLNIKILTNKIYHGLFLFMLCVSFLLCQIPEKRVIAEWEPALGTMIRWPLGIPSDLVVELATENMIYVLVETNNQQNQARNNFNNWGIDLSNVIFINTDTYSHWTRDHGPQFVIDDLSFKVINQQFDGYPVESGCDRKKTEINRYKLEGRPLPSSSRGWDEDDDTNIDFANQMSWDIQNLPLYWTGGNFMTDGYGMGFSTQLMVNENNMSNDDFQSIININLSIDDYVILDNPNVESIQHIDCLAKLVNSETIIIKQVSESSPEYECMEEFAQSFYELHTFYGRPFKIHRIFCPTINGGFWETNPVAAYTNSLILNNKVLVPQYGISEDIEALNVYREAMPGYEIIGVDGAANNPWYAEDALHCRTMGIFDPNMIHISHKSIRDEDVINNNEIEIIAEVLDYGNPELELEFASIYWKYASNDGPFSEVPLLNISASHYKGMLPSINSGASIQYYLEVKNIFGKTASHPNHGWHEFSSMDMLIGDVNGDEVINVNDIIVTINIILGSEQFILSADINMDGLIDVIDVILLVNLIIT